MTKPLPDSIRNRALQLRGSGDQAKWDAGDFVAEVLDMPEVKALGLSVTAIHRALAHDLGLGYSTVRKYEDCARKYWIFQRAAFSDVLTFDHYAAAMYAPEPMIVLGRAVTSADDFGGRPAPVDVIRAWVREINNGHERTEAERFELYLTRARHNLELALELSARMAQAPDAMGFIRDALAMLEKKGL